MNVDKMSAMISILINIAFIVKQGGVFNQHHVFLTHTMNEQLDKLVVLISTDID